MACFIVPATEAIVTTAIAKVVEKKEIKEGTLKENSFAIKLKNLNGLLWGGSVLLAFEHLWHGEIQPFFPFLTAAESADSLAEMFHEMGTVGVGMAAVVTVAWGVITAVTMKMGEKLKEENSNKAKAIN